MTRPGLRKTVLSLAVAGAFAGGITQAHASGFALIEQSASGIGSSFAGQAATSDDASIIFYNPAGMSFLGQGMQFSGGLAFINISTKFSDGGTTPPFGAVPKGGDGGDAGGLATVPNLYFAMDIAKDWKFGVGISAPFGLKTEYDSSWMGRFQATKSEISSYNINPSVSWKINDKTSVGFGVNYQQFKATLNSAVDFQGATLAALVKAGTPPAVAAGAAGTVTPAEGTASVTGDDTGWGYNFGVMFQPTPETTVGLSYRSSITYTIKGTVTYGSVPNNFPSPLIAANFTNANVSLDLKTPDSASLAVQHQLNQQWTILADASWTGWSKIQSLNITRDDNGSTVGGAATPENFKDTWRFGLGGVYRSSDAWSIKMGLAYDQSPVNNTDRTPRLPDNDRTWVSVGGQYRMSKASTLDFGYAHLFVKNTSIDQSGVNSQVVGHLVGTYSSSIDILGAQFSYKF
jgi:long-chain fatty acid transport protein